MKCEELIGRKFGRLLVVNKLTSNKNSNMRWECSCDCGKTHVAISRDLKNGRISSCGCLKNESVGNRFRTHGLTNSRIYSIWYGMKSRCKSSNLRISKYYKNRGITFSNRWNKFSNFKDDMYESYLKHVELHGEKYTTLDRINGKLGYNKKNCRWATPKEQRKNSRKRFSINDYSEMVIFLQELDPAIVINEKRFIEISEKMRLIK